MKRTSSKLSARRAMGRVFLGTCIAATAAGILVLAVLLITTAGDGMGRLSWDFLNNYPSRFADRAGIKPPSESPAE